MNLMNFLRPLTWQELIFNSSGGNILGILQEALVQGKNDDYLKNIINGFLNNSQLETIQKYIPFFIYYCAQFKRFSFLDWLFIEKNLLVDCVSAEGKTPLCYLTEGGMSNLEAINYLLSKGARVYIPESIYQPIVCSLKNKHYENIFIRLLNERRSPLDLIDPDTSETILIKIIKHLGETTNKGNENIIFHFCMEFNRQHGLHSFCKYINHRGYQLKSAIELACYYERYNIVRFLIINGARLPFDHVLETKHSFATIYCFRKKKDIWIAERQNPSLLEFIQKIRMLKCRDWDRLSFQALRNIYILPYKKIDIIKACFKCCLDEMSHDIDSVKYFCNDFQKNKRVSVLQRQFRRRKLKSDMIVSVINIQRWWRSIYYSKRNKSFFCPICREEPENNPILGHPWYLLSCGHLVHSYCLNKWRQNCPTCRAIFSFPLGRLSQYPVPN